MVSCEFPLVTVCTNNANVGTILMLTSHWHRTAFVDTELGGCFGAAGSSRRC